MSIEYEHSNERDLPGFRGEIDEPLKFPTSITNCNGEIETLVVELRHIIKNRKNGGWIDSYDREGNEIEECDDDVHKLKPVKIPYEIVVEAKLNQ